MTAFRIQAKNIFLTYSNATLDNESLLEFLKSIGKPYRIRVCQEHHENGNLHSHALVCYKNKQQITNPRLYDFQDKHPKIEGARSKGAAQNYFRKEGNFLDWSDNSTEEEEENLYELAKTIPYEEFMNHCIKRKIPFGYATDAIKRANTVDPTIFEEDEIPGNTTEKLNWHAYDSNEQCIKSIVLVGPTGCGKTVWAKRNAPKPALFVSHMDDLKCLRAEHKSIIFDDMMFKHMPVQAQIHIVDRYEPRSIHVRYGTTRIPAKIVKIFTCNELPFEVHPAITRRINKIDLY